MKTIFQFCVSAIIIALTFAQLSFAQSIYKLPDLTYGYASLEPFIDSQTMVIHHSKHHQGYINNLNKAIDGTDLTKLSLEDILKNVSNYSATIRNNAGGHYNHSLFWTILTPKRDTKPSDRLMEAIQKEFGSLDSLKIILNDAASKQFGSGWAWLSVGSDLKLFVSSTPNQDNPLMDIVGKRGTPIIGIDVWEHAYYLKYQNKRGDYLAAIWQVINWDEISKKYEALVPKGKFDDWQALKAFHGVMSQTFHPSEEGNLEPIKSRINEFVEKANLLSQSNVPLQFDSKEVRTAINKLYSESKKLQTRMKNKPSDNEIQTSLNQLHDIFHEIIGLCTHNDH